MKRSLLEGILFEPGVIDEGLPAAEGAVSAINLGSGLQRYEPALEKKLYSTINQLERLQPTRRREFISVPPSVDLLINRPERGA